MVTSRSAESRYLVSPAKVLGCLRTGKLTVILFQGVGFVNGGLVPDGTNSHMIRIELERGRNTNHAKT